MNIEELPWQRICGTSACLEIARHNGVVYLRASQRPLTVIELTEAEWLGVKEAIHRGEIA